MTWAGVLAGGDQRIVGDEHRDLACHQLAGRPQADCLGAEEQVAGITVELGALAFVERGLDGQLVQPELGVDHRVPPQPDRRLITDPATTTAPGLALSTPTAGGVTIAELSGELDLICAAALREQLLGLLRPAPADSSSTCPR
jgi:hypothetical protein